MINKSYFEQPLLPKQTLLAFHALLTFATLSKLRQSNKFTCLYNSGKRRAKQQICTLICVICKGSLNKQIFITFETYVNAPQIYSCTSPLHEDAKLEQMWHLRSLLWVANLVQYQSLLLNKFEQICANVVFATLLLKFCYPGKSIFSSSEHQGKSNHSQLFIKM